jgi:hypothetical protein
VAPTLSLVADRTILVVEDEATIAGSVAARLRKEGFAVEIAADGPAAVDRARALLPDLVILDVMRAHVMQMLLGGSSHAIPVIGGEPDLGRWQRLLLLELDEPRERRVAFHAFGV